MGFYDNLAAKLGAITPGQWGQVMAHSNQGQITPTQRSQLAAPLQGGGNPFDSMQQFHQQSLATPQHAQQMAAPLQGPGGAFGNMQAFAQRQNAPTPEQLAQIAGGAPQGVTRQGSQMIDANGQVIGHYGDQNQPVYNQGQGPGGGGLYDPTTNPNGTELPWRPMQNDYIPPPPGWTPPQPPSGGWGKGGGWGSGGSQPIAPFDPTDYARFSSAYAPPANPLSGYSLGRLGGR